METVTILPAEWVGKAAHDKEGILTIGTGDNIVRLPLTKGTMPRWWKDECVDVYVRRLSSDLSICEILIAQHDGYVVEELDNEKDEAERYPLGPKEYYRTKHVGKLQYADGHLMTNEEFEFDWEESMLEAEADEE
jgi:hypothetical protein